MYCLMPRDISYRLSTLQAPGPANTACTGAQRDTTKDGLSKRAELSISCQPVTGREINGEQVSGESDQEKCNMLQSALSQVKYCQYPK